MVYVYPSFISGELKSVRAEAHGLVPMAEFQPRAQGQRHSISWNVAAETGSVSRSWSAKSFSIPYAKVQIASSLKHLLVSPRECFGLQVLEIKVSQTKGLRKSGNPDQK